MHGLASVHILVFSGKGEPLVGFAILFFTMSKKCVKTLERKDCYQYRSV